MKIPLQGFDAMDAHSIAKNMSQRLAIYKSEQKADTGVDKLTTSSGVQGSSPRPQDVKKAMPRLRDVDAMAAQLYK
jgi:hypothetical protein